MINCQLLVLKRNGGNRSEYFSSPALEKRLHHLDALTTKICINRTLVQSECAFCGYIFSLHYRGAVR